MQRTSKPHDYDDTGAYSEEDFFTGVSEILEQALKREPQRQDLRLRLLEVCCASGARDDFVAHALEFRKQVTDLSSADWQRVVAMQQTLLDPHKSFKTSESSDGATRNSDGSFRRFGDEADPSALSELGDAYRALREQKGFFREVDNRQVLFTGERPSPIYWANRLSTDTGGAQIHLKREGLRSLGAHKLLNSVGQVLIAKKLGRKRITAATTTGQGGVATAAAAAHFNLACVIYMHRDDYQRNQAMARRIELLGAKLIRVGGRKVGTSVGRGAAYVKHLNEVRNPALNDWLGEREDSFYVNGLAAGPDPYPSMQRDFLAIIGREARQAMIETTGKLPAALVASVNSDMDIISFFTPFLQYQNTRLVGTSLLKSSDTPGLAEDTDSGRTKFTRYSGTQIDAAARVLNAQGFPSVSREHQWLKGTGRVGYRNIERLKAEEAARNLAKREGLVISLESACALAHAVKLSATMQPDQHIVVLLNDVGTVLATSPMLAALDGSALG